MCYLCWCGNNSFLNVHAYKKFIKQLCYRFYIIFLDESSKTFTQMVSNYYSHGLL